MAIKIDIEIQPNYITQLTGYRGKITASHTITNKDESERKEILGCTFYLEDKLMPAFCGGVKKRLWYAVKRQAKLLNWIKG
jgi:hypothetical protein